MGEGMTKTAPLPGKGRPGNPVVLGVVLVFLAISLVAGCSTQDVQQAKGTPQKPLIWPAPPAPPRITYTQLIERPADIGVKKGLFTRLVEFVVGERYDAIVKPYGMAVDSTGRIIVADTALKRVHIFDPAKNKYSFIENAGDREFLSPIGVTVDDTDLIYVTDSVLAKVLAFDRDGSFVYEVDAGIRPTGIAFNRANDRFYVSDTASHQLLAFNSEGDLLGTIGKWGNGEGEFNFPVDIFTDDEGDIYVVDSMNYRVQIFDKSEKFRTAFGRHGDGTGEFGRPKGLAVDSEGNIYVADALFDTVQIFNRDGDYLLNFGTLGKRPGNFWLPTGLYIDGADNIYVADSYNKRVQIFEYMGSGS